MSRINKRFVKWGTGTDDVNSHIVPANYTPVNYTPTQVGTEGNDKISSHLKGIDSAIASLTPPPATDLSLTNFNIANNTSTPTDVTGFIFNPALVSSFIATVMVTINATTNLYEQFEIRGINKGTSWGVAATSIGDISDVVFSITGTGQIQYTCNDYGGSFTSGTIKFRAITTTI